MLSDCSHRKKEKKEKQEKKAGRTARPLALPLSLLDADNCGSRSSSASRPHLPRCSCTPRSILRTITKASACTQTKTVRERSPHSEPLHCIAVHVTMSLRSVAAVASEAGCHCDACAAIRQRREQIVAAQRSLLARLLASRIRRLRRSPLTAVYVCGLIVFCSVVAR